MSEQHPATAVIFHGEPAPVTPKATLWDWVKYYVYNLARKPKVMVKQRQLIAIAENIQAAIKGEVLPVLGRRIGNCRECTDAFMALRGQVFASQIEFVIKHLRCDNHPEDFTEFVRRHGHLFRLSEDISAWINGFSR